MTHFLLRVTPDSTTRVIIAVSKKVSKKAVTRNLVKRRIRPIIAQLKLKPAKYLLIVQPGAEKIKGKELENEIKKLVAKS